MRVIYVAGAYRADSENGVFENIMCARRAAQKLWHKGWAVICPHTNTMFMGEDKPDLIFLDGDLEILRRCDAIYMLSNWRESVGAMQERKAAEEWGLEIYFEGKDGTV